MKIEQIEKDGKIYFIVDGKEMPLYDENGNTNEELLAILDTEKQNCENSNPTSQKGELMVIEQPRKKMKLSKTSKRRIIAGTLAILIAAGTIILVVKSCKGKDKNNTAVVDEIKEEEYSRELLNKRIVKFAKKANEKGISVTEQDVRDFAIFMNIDRIINEDPELAKEYFDGKNAQDVLSNAGHMIGVLMTTSHTSGYKNSMNLSSLVVGSDYDKHIMKKLEGYRDELTTMRAEESGMHRASFEDEAKTTRFNEIITDTLDFYSMTANGLEIDGKNAVIQKMGDGDRFATVLVMNEINIGNKDLLSNEQRRAFEKLMSNEATVANLQRMIDGCQTKEAETEKQKTIKK